MFLVIEEFPAKPSLGERERERKMEGEISSTLQSHQKPFNVFILPCKLKQGVPLPIKSSIKTMSLIPNSWRILRAPGMFLNEETAISDSL